MKHRRNVQCTGRNIAQYKRVSHKVEIDMIFTLLGMALCFTKLDIYTPSLG